MLGIWHGDNWLKRDLAKPIYVRALLGWNMVVPFPFGFCIH